MQECDLCFMKKGQGKVAIGGLNVEINKMVMLNEFLKIYS